jgi:hypothetical protein
MNVTRRRWTVWALFLVASFGVLSWVGSVGGM